MSTSSSSSSTISDRRTCWVCFGTDDDVRLDWLSPCKCRGTSKFVHVKCLQRWIDVKQKSVPYTKVHCPQCNHPYDIIYPRMGIGMKLLDILEKYIHKSCPYVAGSVIMGSVYWTSVTYGAVTVMQVLGHKEGLRVMEQADPILLFIGLPVIPLSLIICKLLRWEEAVLRMWRRFSSKLPFFGTQDSNAWNTTGEADEIIPVSYTRVLVGALVFPTMSTLMGKLFFRSFKSNFQRSLMGGISYFLMKGFLRMCYLQMTYNRRIQRKVQNYEGEEEGVARRQS